MLYPGVHGFYLVPLLTALSGGLRAFPVVAGFACLIGGGFWATGRWTHGKKPLRPWRRRGVLPAAVLLMGVFLLWRGWVGTPKPGPDVYPPVYLVWCC